MGVSAVNQADFLRLVLVVLLAVGAVWLLQSPSWPAAVFTGVMVLLSPGVADLQYRHRDDWGAFDPDQVRRGAITAFGVLSVGLVYLGLGFADVLVRQSQKGKRGVRRRARARVEEGGSGGHGTRAGRPRVA